MEKVWKFRGFWILFFPALLVGSVSFVQSVLFCITLLCAGGAALLCLAVLPFLSTHQKGRFYFFLLLFPFITYIPYSFLCPGEYPDYFWQFWSYFSLILPLVPLVLALWEEDKQFSSCARFFFIFLFLLCGILLLCGFCREILDFGEFHFWKGNTGVVSWKSVWKFLGIPSLENQFFTSPAGGLFFIGLAGGIFYEKLRKKYES